MHDEDVWCMVPKGKPRASHRTARPLPLFKCGVEPTSAGVYECSTRKRVALGPIRAPNEADYAYGGECLDTLLYTSIHECTCRAVPPQQNGLTTLHEREEVEGEGREGGGQLEAGRTCFCEVSTAY